MTNHTRITVTAIQAAKQALKYAGTTAVTEAEFNRQAVRLAQWMTEKGMVKG